MRIVAEIPCEENEEMIKYLKYIITCLEGGYSQGQGSHGRSSYWFKHDQ